MVNVRKPCAAFDGGCPERDRLEIQQQSRARTEQHFVTQDLFINGGHFVGHPIIYRIAASISKPQIPRISRGKIECHAMQSLVSNGEQPSLIVVADSGRCRSAFRTDVDHDSEVMPISVPN
jgi:hypothetical protein